MDGWAGWREGAAGPEMPNMPPRGTVGTVVRRMSGDDTRKMVLQRRRRSLCRGPPSKGLQHEVIERREGGEEAQRTLA